MKLLTILGARPQFIKSAAVSRAISLEDDVSEVIVHTGQHFDQNMSGIFFDQLDLKHPNYNLQISGLSHGVMTGRMIEGIEDVIKREQPDWLLVYGDTNSTLSGALAAVKCHIPIAHVEAGLRSHNPAMPEEINRVLTDRVSTLLLCPTQRAVTNLIKEGYPFEASKSQNCKVTQRIANVGDVMYDAVRYYRNIASSVTNLEDYRVTKNNYVLCTLHRQENTDQQERLDNILTALREISKDMPVLLPLHPRTKQKIEKQCSHNALKGINILNPQPYLQMQRLEMDAFAILTDSGGVQKEAYFHNVPCITLRDETEWTETVEAGWNQLSGSATHRILDCFYNPISGKNKSNSYYGNGNAASIIIKEIKNF